MSHSPGIFSILVFPVQLKFHLHTSVQSLPSYLPRMWHSHTLPGPGGSVGHGCKLSWPHNFRISCVHKTTQAMLPSSASSGSREAPFYNSVDDLSLSCWTWANTSLSSCFGQRAPLTEYCWQFMLFVGGFTFSQIWGGSRLEVLSWKQLSCLWRAFIRSVGAFTSMVNITIWWVYMLFCLHSMSLDIKPSFPLAV